MTSITRLSALALAQRIREGDISPLEAVEAHIERIEAVNPALNAVVLPLFEEARREAQALMNSDDTGRPLFGVPFTVKDSLDVAGARATAGLTARCTYRATQDAAVVARLRAAGAVVIAKTNTPDNCWDQETTNLLFGRTNNPWDVLRSVGGSTGGEAAIIAAGGSPLGVGSDIAGSIRLPAAFTGIVGLRPTSGALAEQGHWPLATGALAELESVGPMARRVEDVAVAFAIMRGALPQTLDIGALAGRTVAYWFDDGTLPASAAVRGGVEAAVRALRRAGMRPLEHAPEMRRFATIGWIAMHDQAARHAIAAGFGGGELWSPAGELLRTLRGRARVSPGALAYWWATHYGSLLTHALGIDGPRWRRRLRSEFITLVGSGGVAVCPVFPTSAPRHGWSWRALGTSVSYQTWVNLGGLPGLTVPVGHTRNGMPIAVQIVGAPGTEQTILAAGLIVQQALMPEWQNPPL